MAINRLAEKKKVAVYANAILDAANTAGGQDSLVEVRNQLKELISLIYADMDLSTALSNPDYTPNERHQLADAVFADCYLPLREVLAVMAENGDANLVTKVFHELEGMLQEKMNLRVVDVVTVVPLDSSLRKLIKDKTEADLGCTAMLNESIDESILGGIIMSTGGMRIDASVISQLNKARHVLKETDGGES